MVPPSYTLSNFLFVSPVVEENKKRCNYDQLIQIVMQMDNIHQNSQIFISVMVRQTSHHDGDNQQLYR